jgi:hypothetical protein
VPNKVGPEEMYAGLDPGIRFAVRVLNAQGIDTCQSCEGGPGHSYDRPSVDLAAGASDATGFAALAAAVDYGLPVDSLARVWNVENGLPYETIWRLTFSQAMPERADELPLFTWHYEVVDASLRRGR